MDRDRIYLRDILVAAQLAVSYLASTSREAFERDTLRQDAVIRRLEIVGEAARRSGCRRARGAGVRRARRSVGSPVTEHPAPPPDLHARTLPMVCVQGVC